MVKTIIKAKPTKKRIPRDDKSSILNVSECFTDTIQGEGINVGFPATFLRMQGCTLNCGWECDTKEVWKVGNKYTVKEILDMWKKKGVVEKLKKQHLVLTGGSPLRQQDSLVELLHLFANRFNFLPFIEVENECVLLPSQLFVQYIDVWNNSPKLSNSGMKKIIRYRPKVIKYMASLKNSWFKFVITSEKDWKEIEEDFLKPQLIKREQIILMPEGVTREELREKYEFVVKLACREGVRFTDRLHITIWNKKVGV